MDKPTKILLILVHSTQNAGDLALLQVSVHQLRRHFKNCIITISANYPDEVWYKEKGYKVISSPISLIGKSTNAPPWLQLTNFILSFVITMLYFLNLRFLIPKSWNLLLDEYKSSDLVVAVPGNQLFSTGRFGWPFPVTIYSVFLAHFFRKPIYVLPQSIGPFRRWWEKILVRYAYSKANLVFLRDQASLEVAQKIGLSMDKVFYAPDPAFALEPCQKEEAIKILSDFGWTSENPSLGVTIIAPQGHFLDPNSLENYYSVLAATLVRISLKWDLQIVFFVQVTGPTEIENDRIPTSQIYNKIRSQVKAIYVDKALRPEILKACYGEMDIFLASRLHSGIFSISMGVPTVFIGYLSKTIGFLKSIEMDKYGIKLDDLNEDVLLKIFEEVWTLRNEISLNMKKLTKKYLLEIDLLFNTVYDKHIHGRKNQNS